jgi:pimeloyl-ACP methyl ester carboxylesterase
MNAVTLNAFCNAHIDIKYEFFEESPITFILSSGYAITSFEEPVQVAFTKLLSSLHINWLQYIFPERNSKNEIEDLYISTGILTLNVLYDWVKQQVGTPIGLFGISFGGNISIEFAAKATVDALIIINVPFDYVDFRRKQLGDDVMRLWQKELVTQIPYANKSFPLGYRFIQEAEAQNLRERACNITCDVHAFQGDQDSIIGIEDIVSLAESIPRWHAHVIQGADHAFNAESSIKLFLEEIHAFIHAFVRQSSLR